MDWQPKAGLPIVRLKAQLLDEIRHFFKSRDVLEVTTPVLSASSVTDPHIQSLETTVSAINGADRCYLQTSPEFHMKRLLAAGADHIYQICPVFRNSDTGRCHQPEFTMLEWYRSDYDHHQLMDEVIELINACFVIVQLNARVTRFSYQDAFLLYADFDPFTATVESCLEYCKTRNVSYPETLGEDLDAWLDLILTQSVAPKFSKSDLTFLYDYPASQAALAKIRVQDGIAVAERFELFWGELELANGFHELTDADEQLLRFQNENKIRLSQGLPEVSIDNKLIAALHSGLPECSGVALGLERLLMVMLKANNIREVMPFPDEHLIT